ncbi:MAG: threonine synthase [Acidobacteria bacterium]|nr:MAG: threonine synthase [Acidobacteriota bacterium]
MRYLSTRGGGAPASFEEALFRGLAEDGGLYLPERLPALAPSFWADLAGRSTSDVALALLAPYVPEVPAAALRAIVDDALDFELPLRRLEGDLYVLELFHGPTLAFKDVGARVMARLMSFFLARRRRRITVLVATSGDTGGAVAQAFHGVAGTRVAVLYPRGRVSPLQERQLATLGGNVRAFAVAGSFDDCQRLTKEAFADGELRRAMQLTSANSINVGRLLPQAIYYALAVAALGGEAPLFAVPSGNFGNLCAGLIAHRMGLPARGFLAATNANDVVPRYLAGEPYAPRPSLPTLSSAMDVGAPSNFDRILALYGGDRRRLQRDVAGSAHDDDATRRAIAEVYARTGRVLDPHAAVGYLALSPAVARRGGPGVLLATAHPAKFLEVVEPIVGPIPLPSALARWQRLPVNAEPLANDLEALRRALLAWPSSP